MGDKIWNKLKISKMNCEKCCEKILFFLFQSSVIEVVMTSSTRLFFGYPQPFENILQPHSPPHGVIPASSCALPGFLYFFLLPHPPSTPPLPSVFLPSSTIHCWFVLHPDLLHISIKLASSFHQACIIFPSSLHHLSIIASSSSYHAIIVFPSSRLHLSFMHAASLWN
jgi:hypothetical protein